MAELRTQNLRWTDGQYVAFCAERGFEFAPALVTELPDFGSAVHEFVAERARRDLPPEQFTQDAPTDCSVLTRELRKLFWEMRGLIFTDCNGGGLVELAYAHPSNTEITWNVRQGITGVGISLFLDEIITPPKQRGALVDYHSHRPFPDDKPTQGASLGDCVSMNELAMHMGKLGEFHFYSVVYLPRTKEALWYKLQQVPREAGRRGE